MAGTHKGIYHPKNPERYVGTGPICYRSSWEYAACVYFDTHDVYWASEPLTIPYYNPFTKRDTVYVPDFLIMYQKNGRNVVEMLEIKPLKEHPFIESANKLTKKDQMSRALNAIKWKAAMMFCKKRNITFRVLTEKDLFLPSKRKHTKK